MVKGLSREYVRSRYANNLSNRIYAGTERFNFPIIKPETYEETEWMGFNKAVTTTRTHIGVHFFMDDFEFERVWNQTNRYVEMLSRFDAVIAPDFSLFSDWPMVVQMWNHYRKHYVAARLQDMGCKVYPNIRWSDERSYEWCFDGEPKHSAVVVSSTGTQKGKESKRLFLNGYQEMMKRLEPTEVIFFGKVPKECEGNIIRVKAFHEKFKGDDG